MIELTGEQQTAIDAENGSPVVIDTRNQATYVLVRTEVFERLKNTATLPMPGTGAPECPEGIALAWAAFRRDLPELMANRQTRGKYVCYRREQRVAVGKDYRSVIAEVVRLDIPEDEYIVEKVQPGAGNVEEEIDRTFVEFDEEPV